MAKIIFDAVVMKLYLLGISANVEDILDLIANYLEEEDKIEELNATLQGELEALRVSFEQSLGIQSWKDGSAYN